MTDYSGVNDAYGKNGTITSSQKFKNSRYMLDDNTRKQLEYIVSGKAEFDDSLIADAKKELDYWNSIVPISGGGYSSGAQSAYNAQLRAIEEQRTYAEKLAEQARQDAIKNAYVTYDRSLPTYGQNAERLAKMGLSNSGYSDYLGGVAYSSMVGGIQDAHKTADKAIQDAYYNAELQKAQAADTLYNRQIAESQIAYDRAQDKAEIDSETKAAYQNVLSQAILSAGSGTNLETALAYAQANGITSESDLQMIRNAAIAYSDVETKNKEETKTESTNAINVEVKGVQNESGDIVFPTFEDLKAKYGNTYSDKEYQEFADESEKNKNKYLYSYYAPQITSETTDSEIDALGLSKEGADKLKADRNNAIVDNVKSNLQAEAQSGNVSLGNIEAIDTLYGNGGINKDTYQEVYFDKAVSFAKGIENLGEYQMAIEQIDGYVNQGKMTRDNAEKVKQYISKSFMTHIPENAYELEGFYEESMKDTLIVKGKRYSIIPAKKQSDVKDDTVKELIDIALGDQKEHGFVMIDDTIYTRWGSPTLSGKTKYLYRELKGSDDLTRELRTLAQTSANTQNAPTYTHLKE